MLALFGHRVFAFFCFIFSGKDNNKAKKGNPADAILPLEDQGEAPNFEVQPGQLDKTDEDKLRKQIFKMTGLWDTKFEINMDEMSFCLVESIKKYNLVGYKELENMTLECYAKGCLMPFGHFFAKHTIPVVPHKGLGEVSKIRHL